MRFLFDLLPLVVFFVAFKVANLYTATALAIACSVGQLGWLKLRRRPIDAMQWLGLGIIVVFGGMTLLLHDETFIKWKPTVLYGAFAIALAFARLLMGRNLVESLMSRQIRLPAPIWDRLNWAWCGFFALMSALNLAVAYRFSTEIWVNFKVFGTTALIIVFVIGQALLLGRHVRDPEEGQP